MSKKLSRIEKRRKAIEEQLAALRAQEKVERRAVAKRGRAAEAREEKVFKKIDTRMMILAGAWLFQEFQKGFEGHEAMQKLEKYFLSDFQNFTHKRDKKFVERLLMFAQWLSLVRLAIRRSRLFMASSAPFTNFLVSPSR